jgi:hypothetical protein
MTLVDIIRKRRGQAAAWRVHPIDSETFSLWHYGTEMLVWTDNPDTGCSTLLDYSLGWGSVSDQQGMNKAFKTLGLPFYYSRAGGAKIVEPFEVIAEIEVTA